MDSKLAGEAWGPPDPLSDREHQVLQLAGDGRSGADIAAALHLSEGTVRNYLSEAIGKTVAAIGLKPPALPATEVGYEQRRARRV